MTGWRKRQVLEMALEAEIKFKTDVFRSDFCDGVYEDDLEHFAELVRADERMSFYGQDKPAECAEGCPPNQICDYCQVVAPVKAMILAEREACAKIADSQLRNTNALLTAPIQSSAAYQIGVAIRARGQA